MAMPLEDLRSPAALLTGASVLDAGGVPELVSEPLTGETSLLEVGADVVPDAAELVLVMRVDDSEPVAGLTSEETA